MSHFLCTFYVLGSFQKPFPKMYSSFVIEYRTNMIPHYAGTNFPLDGIRWNPVKWPRVARCRVAESRFAEISAHQVPIRVARIYSPRRSALPPTSDDTEASQ